MLSSISSLQSAMFKYDVVTDTSSDISFTSFPSSIVVRYDLYYASGRESTSGDKVTTNNAHIYKILDKSGNGHHLISASTNSTPSNRLVNSGLGSINKPCVNINPTVSGNSSTSTGYYTTTNPAFPNGFELICVIRPLSYTVVSPALKSQNLINKYTPGNGFPAPFVIRTNRVIASGSTSSTWDNSSLLNMTVQTASGYILGSRYFKANATTNGNTLGNGFAQDRLNGTNTGTPFNLGTANYLDTANGFLGLCYRPALPNQNQAFEVGEMLLFNAPLSPSDRELIEAYLATKWGIPITNTAHTYYNKSVFYNGSNP